MAPIIILINFHLFSYYNHLLIYALKFYRFGKYKLKSYAKKERHIDESIEQVIK